VGLSSLVCIALALELAAAGSGLLKPGDQNHLACRVMPNGVVPVVTGTTSLCNLEPFDHVIAAISTWRARAAANAAGAAHNYDLPYGNGAALWAPSPNPIKRILGIVDMMRGFPVHTSTDP
jgi:hypothetical protein